MTYNDALNIFVWMRANYPNASKYTKNDVEIWAKCWLNEFADIPPALVLKGCRMQQQKSNFMPSIAEVTENLRKLLIEVEGKISEDNANRYNNRHSLDKELRERVELLLEPYIVDWNEEPAPTLSEQQRRGLEYVRDVLNTHFGQQNFVDAILGGGAYIES